MMTLKQRLHKRAYQRRWYKANMAKSNLTPAQLLLFSKWVLAQAGT